MRTPLALLVLVLAYLPAAAQGPRPPVGKKHPSFLRIENGPPTFRKDEFFRAMFDMGEADELRSIGLSSDALRQVHEKFQQHYKGVRVDGAVVTVHSRNGQINLLSGNYRSVHDLDVRPTLPEPAARQRALRHVNAQRYIWHDSEQGGPREMPAAELVIAADPEGRTPARLAWKFDIYALQPLYRAFVYVDAHRGDIIQEQHCIHTTDVPATGASRYNGAVSFTADFTGAGYRLRQARDGRGIESYSMRNGSSYSNAIDINSASANFTSDNVAVQAHWGAEKTHQYFRQKHNRNSFDGNGAVIRSYVHYLSNYVNAFWDGQRVTYGDGNGSTYGPLVSLDIIGHEITHGVTQFSAGLVYSYESGALNESFSDIFGEAVEYFATGKNDWYVGGDIDLVDGNGIRSMRNPNLFSDPDTYKGAYWYSGSGDNGGVHINSGVQNKWFYILTVGESGVNDRGDSYQVSGIGIDKAAAIAYRNLTVYLSPSSQYADAREGAIQAARDLFGEGSPEEIATQNAWYAVGVGSPYGTAGYCSSNGASAAFEWIARVAIGSFTHASGAAGYSDFTSKNITLTPGQTHPVSLTPAFSSTTWLEYWRIWIDYNGDGDFSDAGELAFDSGGLSSSTVNGAIAVPSGATGTTRLRIAMKWEGAPSPCEVFSYGEVEDYTVAFNGSGGDSQPPSAPGNLTASNITQTSTNLNWNASTDNVGVTGYRIFVNGDYHGASTTTSYSVGGLAPATTYTLSVRARDAAGNLSNPSAVQVTTLPAADTQPPAAPGNLTASNITQTAAALAWSPSSDNVGVTGYIVYVNGGYYTATIATTATVGGLSAGTTYTLSVRARDAAGNLSNPSAVQVTTLPAADTQPPAAPGNLTASNITQTAAALAWSPSSDNVGVTGYNVYVNNNYIGVTATTSYTVTGLASGTTYALAVRARDAAGNLSNPSAVQVTTLPAADTQPPAAPGNLTASNITQTAAALAWSPSSDNVGVTGYNVYVNNNYIGVTATTSYTVTGLASGTTYALAVRARDAAGNLSNASSVLVTTSGPRPDDESTGAPQNLKAGNTTQTSTVLSWSPPLNFPSIAGYRVYVDGVYRSYTTATSITVNWLLPGTTYAMSVRAVSTVGDLSQPATINVTTLAYNLAVSGNDGHGIRPAPALRVFPNPARDYLSVQIPADVTVLSGHIVAIDGRRIHLPFDRRNDGRFDVSALKAGVYVLIVETDAGVLTARFVRE